MTHSPKFYLTKRHNGYYYLEFYGNGSGGGEQSDAPTSPTHRSVFACTRSR